MSAKSTTVEHAAKTHAQLKLKVDGMRDGCPFALQEAKKQKLQAKDELARLERSARPPFRSIRSIAAE